MVYTIKDITVIITGGASGIGAGVAWKICAEGARYLAILDISTEQGLRLEKEINEKHPNTKAKYYKCDVTNDEELGNIFRTIKKEIGQIDLVINSAGIFNDKLFIKSVDINVNGVISSSLKAFELMRKDHGGNGGAIINFSSVAGLQNIAAVPVYCATKTAVLQFSLCLGKGLNYTRSGIRVITLCFGATDTAILHGENIAAFDESNFQELIHLIENCKIQKVESAANCVLHAFKNGETASTWISMNDNPPLEITARVQKAFQMLGEGAQIKSDA